MPTDYVNRVLPVGDAPVTGGFGADYGGYLHRGVDFGVPVGTPVYAPQEGRAIEVFNPDGSFGTAVAIDHEDTPFYALFAHLSRADVRAGQWVFAGQQIGLSGNTGKSSGPHLHWQMSYEKTFPTDITRNVDPLAFPLVPLEDDMADPRVDALVAALGGMAEIEAWNARGNSLLLGYANEQKRTGELEGVLSAHIASPHVGGGITPEQFARAIELGAKATADSIKFAGQVNGG